MLTTILRPSSVWCGKKKTRHFGIYRKNKKNKPKLYCSLTVCVWQHLFTFIQYKFSFPCVQMLIYLIKKLALSLRKCLLMVPDHFFFFLASVLIKSAVHIYRIPVGIFFSSISFPFSFFVSCQVNHSLYRLFIILGIPFSSYTAVTIALDSIFRLPRHWSGHPSNNHERTLACLTTVRSLFFVSIWPD